MATVDTDELFGKAQELAQTRQSVLDQQKAVREVLRNLQTAGMLSEEEEALLEEIFPVRTRNRGEDDDGLDDGLDPEPED